ncbi:MAG TPA: hypothetical protein VNN76_05445, partial [Bacteroidota bacterium]|nr:hypothetical protein [Bacteroidota bacterium]
ESISLGSNLIVGENGWGAGVAILFNFFSTPQERMFGEVSYAFGPSFSIVDRWKNDPTPPYLKTSSILPWFEPARVHQSPQSSYEIGLRGIVAGTIGGEIGFSPKVYRVYQIYRSTVSDSLYYRQESAKTVSGIYARLMYTVQLHLGSQQRLPLAVGVGYNGTTGFNLFLGVRWF